MLTAPTDRLLITGGGWGGQLFFLSDRQGLSIWDTQLLEDKKTYARLKEAGITKLVMVSESPLHSAIQHFTSTSATPDRDVYQTHTTPIVDGLPTVFQNDDLLIKSLP